MPDDRKAEKTIRKPFCPLASPLLTSWRAASDALKENSTDYPEAFVCPFLLDRALSLFAEAVIIPRCIFIVFYLDVEL